ncbi:hypothetical protein KVG96_13410 [Pseudomonas sp. COR58]|uniref:MBL fold metallo-hydrolase n=1 Tax=Pseudomonas ekonensis TaxID=2842353 RepID=A0ABS6PEQ0_9PSED|nr:hypothetical protein [Pseudomonas ekonensis]MBV4458953.1 hypothetical protein [Pseudomonas ekonensis]
MPVILLIVLMVLTGCTRDPLDQNLRVSDDHALAGPKIQFLGVGGWLLHWKGESLMLAPSFSNPGLFGLRGVPSPLVLANERKIDDAMREVPDAADVRMLLVGHGHYDHLLDVPIIVRKYTPRATIYGSATVKHILQGFDELKRFPVVDVQDVMAKLKGFGEPGPLMKEGQWFPSPSGRIRVMPIQSEHAGHVAGLNLIPGDYHTDLTKPELSLWRWKPGQSLAWIIDLMDDTAKNTVYRIHYQDSAATPPFGYMPALADGKGVDVEILCASSWKQVRHYPQRVLERHRPRMVLIGHWENFFGSDPREPRLLAGQDVRSMIRVVQTTVGPQVPVVLPAPLSEVRFPAPEKKPLP